MTNPMRSCGGGGDDEKKIMIERWGQDQRVSHASRGQRGQFGPGPVKHTTLQLCNTL